MLRKILGIVAGAVAGMLVIEVLLRVGHALFPLPPADSADREAVLLALRNAPAALLLWTALSWFAGTLAGVFLVQRLSGAPTERWPATLVEAFLLAQALLHLLTVKPAIWFWILGLAAFPLGYALGLRLARPK
jgi:hypothetical protein